MAHCRETTGGQGVHREVGSEGLAEEYRAVIEGALPHDESVGQRRGKVEPARWRRRRSYLPTRRTKVFASGTGTGELDVTPGGLVVFSGGTGTTDPKSREAKWGRMRGEQSDNRTVPQARRKPGDRASSGRVGRGSRLAEAAGESRR